MGIALRRRFALGTVVAFGIAAAIIAVRPGGARADDGAAKAILHNQAGQRIGVVQFIQQGSKVLVKASVESLSEGFHGFHIHAVGVCTGTFTSAGGHLGHNAADPATTPHGSADHHEGDMPSLLAADDGGAWARFKTDRVAVEDIVGHAVIVHAGVDNFANIPARYGAPDAATLGTGDAGARFACGVIESSD